ncbi:MAG: hypothetical protein ACXV2C_02890 [Candidatus Bathyarchaeia archaeon]
MPSPPITHPAGTPTLGVALFKVYDGFPEVGKVQEVTDVKDVAPSRSSDWHKAVPGIKRQKQYNKRAVIVTVRILAVRFMVIRFGS